MSGNRGESAIVRRSADNLYGSGQKIWFDDDRWNAHKRQRIERFVLKTYDFSKNGSSVLDAGSGNTLYSWMPMKRISTDRFHSQLVTKRDAVVCDLEALPFADESFDLVFCIGAVINYVSALEAINELSRVTKFGGRLYLHFESSASFEQLGKPSWNASAYLHNTINSSRVDHIWIYSPKFIYDSLHAARFSILECSEFHVLSALLIRFGISQNRAALAGIFDGGAPLLRKFADDVIVLAEKI
jgi:SAM-dependent methyltransferase